MNQRSPLSKHLVALVLMLSFIPNSCQIEPSGSRSENFVLTPGSSDRTDCNYVQFEQYGIQFYEHLKYNFLNAPPEDLLPEEYRVSFMHKFDSLKTVTNDWELDSVLNHFESGGAISLALKQNVEELNDLIQSFGSGTANYQTTLYAIQQLTSSKTGNLNISCSDKCNIVLINSICSKFLTYLNEVNWLEQINTGGAQNRGDCAGVADLILCYFSVVAVSTLIGLLAAAVGVPFGIPGITGIVGAIWAAYTVLNSSWVCFCEDDECKPPLGVSLKFSDCSAVAEYTAFGFGSDITNLTWANGGGTPAVAMTPASAPRVTITQSSDPIPVTTIITATCSNYNLSISAAFVRNLSALAKTVFGVSLTGPTQVYPPAERTYIYYASGITSNPNYSIIQWHVTNGTVVNSFFNRAHILWDTNMTTGTLTVTIKNMCEGGETRHYTLNVTDGGPIP